MGNERCADATFVSEMLVHSERCVAKVGRQVRESRFADPSNKHEVSMAVFLVTFEQVRCQGGAKRTASDDDKVEFFRIRSQLPTGLAADWYCPWLPAKCSSYTVRQHLVKTMFRN